jgi:putative ABC transport system permease protein
LRFTLMLAQAALSVVLLIGAGLFVRSLRNIAGREVGIDRDRVLRVTMPLARFGFDTAQIIAIYQRGTERLRAIPGVVSVAAAGLTIPMGSATATSFSVAGVKRPKLALGGPYNSIITAGFFKTIGGRMISGRELSAAEEATPSRVVIVNELLAKAYWPNATAIGQCVRYGSDSGCSEVVGVVGTMMQFSLINDDRAIVYAPLTHPGAKRALPSAILVRVAGNPANTVPLVRRELQALAPTMPFVEVKSYSELVAPQLQPWRLGATMFTLFGLIALVIAAVGLYSVMAYWVSQRTHEIGVRMALGAKRQDVIRLVAVQSSRAIIAGLLLGGAAAFIASRWIADMLYETSPHDPIVYSGAAMVLGIAAIIASAVPVRRSTAVDPAQAIRTD